MVDKEKVSEVLDLIRPQLQADGGDVELVDISEDGIVAVRLLGHCAGCPMRQMTLTEGIGRVLKEHVEGVKDVVPVELD